jgi:hypothetical protein
MHRTYIGFDPGLGGGVVAISNDRVYWSPMPETDFDLLQWLNSTIDQYACIEWINPGIQGIGKSSMSKLYGNYRVCQMACTALEIPQEDVKPKAWQSFFSIKPKGKSENTYKWKGRLRDKAQKLYPKLDLWKETQAVQRAVADALLIATYCKRTHEGKH